MHKDWAAILIGSYETDMRILTLLLLLSATPFVFTSCVYGMIKSENEGGYLASSYQHAIDGSVAAYAAWHPVSDAALQSMRAADSLLAAPCPRGADANPPQTGAHSRNRAISCTAVSVHGEGVHTWFEAVLVPKVTIFVPPAVWNEAGLRQAILEMATSQSRLCEDRRAHETGNVREIELRDLGCGAAPRPRRVQVIVTPNPWNVCSSRRLGASTIETTCHPPYRQVIQRLSLS